MARQNKVSATLSDADQQTILTKANEIKALLPFLLNLSNTERKKFRKMGPKSVDYVALCVTGAQDFSNTLANDFNVTEFGNDAGLIVSLTRIHTVLQSITEGLGDTLLAAGSDAMAGADEVYGSLKGAAKRDANVKALVEQIGQRFKGQGKKKATPKP